MLIHATLPGLNLEKKTKKLPDNLTMPTRINHSDYASFKKMHSQRDLFFYPKIRGDKILHQNLDVF